MGKSSIAGSVGPATVTRLDAIDGFPNPLRIPRVGKWVLENYPVRAKVGDTVVALRSEVPRSARDDKEN